MSTLTAADDTHLPTLKEQKVKLAYTDTMAS